MMNENLYILFFVVSVVILFSIFLIEVIARKRDDRIHAWVQDSIKTAHGTTYVLVLPDGSKKTITKSKGVQYANKTPVVLCKRNNKLTFVDR